MQYLEWRLVFLSRRALPIENLAAAIGVNATENGPSNVEHFYFLGTNKDLTQQLMSDKKKNVFRKRGGKHAPRLRHQGYQVSPQIFVFQPERSELSFVVLPPVRQALRDHCVDVRLILC